MVKLSNKQQIDLETVKYFIPDQARHWPITGQDVEIHFNWSDRGIDLPAPYMRSLGLNALVAGKTYRDWHVKDYKHAIQEGTLFLFELVDDMPENVGRYVVRSLGFGNYDMIKAYFSVSRSPFGT